jgi:ribosomal protein S18 acetylase RimI-like enzyme
MGDDVTLRRWSRDDLAGMVALINARVATEGEGEFATVASMAEQYDHLRNCDPDTDIVVAVDASGDIVGYSRVFWLDVDDGHRGYYVAFEARDDVGGLTEAMFDWGLERATQVAATHDHPDRRLDAWANEGTPRARLVEARGFEPYAWSAFMVRPHFDDIPPAPLPDGLEVRPVEPDHWRRIWEADITAFRDHRFYVEQTETDWERFIDEAKQGTELWQVAWDGDDVAGQVRTRFNDEEIARLGRRRAWTEDISTRRDWRGRGVASALIAGSLRQLAELGFHEAALGVDLDNPTGALGVYERLGYRSVLRQAQYHRRIT